MVHFTAGRKKIQARNLFFLLQFFHEYKSVNYLFCECNNSLFLPLFLHIAKFLRKSTKNFCISPLMTWGTTPFSSQPQ